MDIDQITEELREVRAAFSLVAEKLDTLIFNFNMIHQAQVDQGTELNMLKSQCAQRSLRCPVLAASHPPPPPVPTPVPTSGSNGGAP